MADVSALLANLADVAQREVKRISEFKRLSPENVETLQRLTGIVSAAAREQRALVALSKKLGVDPARGVEVVKKLIRDNPAVRQAAIETLKELDDGQAPA